jgi:hypothetical protein
MLDIMKDLYDALTKDLTRIVTLCAIGLIIAIGFGWSYMDMILSWPSPDIAINQQDNTTWLHLATVRDALSGHAPSSTFMPLSDLLLSTLAGGLPTTIMVEKRLMLVTAWLPILLGLASLLCLGAAAQTRKKHPEKFGLVILCSFFSFPALYHFLPGNAAQQSLQSFLWCLLLYIYQKPRTGITLTAMAGVVGLWLWTGPTIPASSPPLFSNEGGLILSILCLPLLTMALLNRFQKQARHLLLPFALCLILTLWHADWFYYLEPLSILAIATYLPPYMRALRRKGPKPIANFTHPYLPIYALYLTLCLLTTWITDTTSASAIQEKQNRECTGNIFYITQSGELAKHLGTTPLTLSINAADLDGAIRFFTPYKITEQNENELYDMTDPELAKSWITKNNISALILCPSQSPSWANAFFQDKATTPNWVQKIDGITYSKNTTEHPIVLKVIPTE